MFFFINSKLSYSFPKALLAQDINFPTYSVVLNFSKSSLLNVCSGYFIVISKPVNDIGGIDTQPKPPFNISSPPSNSCFNFKYLYLYFLAFCLYISLIYIYIYILIYINNCFKNILYIFLTLFTSLFHTASNLF